MIVAPATFNTINKWAAGISDTLALGLLTEAIGKGLPLVALPFLNVAQARHPAFARSVEQLRQAGVRFDVPGRLPTATVVQVYAEEPELTPLGRLWSRLTERFANGQTTAPEAKRRAQVDGARGGNERRATDGYEPPVGEGAEA